MVTDADYSSQELALPAWIGAALGLLAGLAIGGAQPLQVLFCMIAGWLYALCQQRTTVLGYLCVGLSYGLVLWGLSRLEIRLHVPVPVTPLGIWLGFTESLAIASILATLRAPSPAAGPKD